MQILRLSVWPYSFSLRIVLLMNHVARIATMNSDKTPPSVFVVPNLFCNLGKAVSKANLRPKQIGINSRTGTYFLGIFIDGAASAVITCPVRRSSCCPRDDLNPSRSPFRFHRCLRFDEAVAGSISAASSLPFGAGTIICWLFTNPNAYARGIRS